MAKYGSMNNRLAENQLNGGLNPSVKVLIQYKDLLTEGVE